MKKKMSYVYQVSLVIATTVLIMSACPIGVNSRVISREEISKSSYAYNLILSGDHTIYQADNEGASAVKGNVNIYIPDGYSFTYGAAAVGTSNIVGTAELATNVPALVLGGDFIGSNLDKVIIQGNGFASREGVDSENKVNIVDGVHIELTDSEITAIFDSLLTESHQRANYWEGKVDVPLKENIEFIPSKSDERILVANTTSGELGELYIPNLDNFDYVVIYSSAEEINISGGAINYNGTIVNTSDSKDKALTELAGKIKWVFPNAEKFNMSYFGAIGNYFAPNATVVAKGGCINGQLIAHNLIQMDGFEMHNFLPTPVLQELDESKETEVVLESEKNEEEVELEKVVAEPEKSTENTEAEPTLESEESVETTELATETIQKSEESFETTEPAETTPESEESLGATELEVETTPESEESLETSEPAVETTQESEESLGTSEPAVETTQESEEPVKTTELEVETTPESEESLGTSEPAVETTQESEEPVKTTELEVETTQESEESLETSEQAVETTQESEEPVKTTELEVETTPESKGPAETTNPETEVTLESVEVTEPKTETTQESEESVETTEPEAETTLVSSTKIASELENSTTEKPKYKISEVSEDDKTKAEAKVELKLEIASKEKKSENGLPDEKIVTANQLSNKTNTDERQTLPRLGSVDTTWIALFGKILLVLAICGFIKNIKHHKA